ncbi:MAG TPA: heavy metal translocating P-type ATPase [Thermoplasmata archaeon]|nr:heavy metal translocating P-type ATPase [Thermoplasmata archaeon]
MATDPVCGMSVEEGADALRLARDNRTYYFCSSECLRSFAAPEEARRRIARRLAVAWPLSLVIVVLTWSPPFAGAAAVAGVLAAIVQFYAGAGFYRGAFDAVRQRVGNMDLLIACGTSAAFLYSAAVLALPGRLPSATYFDASALIVTVILTGNYLEQLTRRRAGSALRHLAEMLPTTASLVEDGQERPVPVADLRVGQRVRVPPGERFPADGLVRAGVSAADEAILTGEAATARKGPGDRVLAGARNVEGPLVIEISSVGPDTFVAHVGQLLQDAELARVPLQRRADRLAALFTPFVLTLALVASVVWFTVGGAGFTVAVLIFVTVAVTACPCAFGLATPAALLVGTGRSAEEGILFRGGDAIERASTVDTVLMDKTGTLTTSEPEVDGVLAVAPATEAEVLQIAAGLEEGIRHPLARALSDAVAARGVAPVRFDQVRLEPGRGVLGRRNDHAAAFLRGEAAATEGIDLASVRPWVAGVESRGRTWSLVVQDGRVLGGVAFRSRLAPGASEAVAELRADGIRLALVTGDNERAAHAVAAELSIDEVHAGVDPDGKLALVREYRERGRRVAFVGDGVNDAAALAAADVGIAIGSGSDVARETGQVLLVRPDLVGVPRALRFARRIVGRVRGNLLWAIGYNAVLLPIAAGALVPAVGFDSYRLLPVLGAVAMGLSSTTVLLNSLTLRWTLGRRAEGSSRVPPTHGAAPRTEAV